MSEPRREKPEQTVEVWAFDEPRLGLKPVPRRQWAPKGQRPTAVVQHRVAWLYLDGFVHPSTGEGIWFICNAVGIDLFGAILAAFAQAVGAGAGKLVLLVLDTRERRSRGAGMSYQIRMISSGLGQLEQALATS